MSAPRTVDTVIVGAGQAGLAMSALLTAGRREHLVVDRRTTLGGGWQDRWDAFQLVTPNVLVALPGLPYDGPDPHGYMTRAELIAHFQRYAAKIDAPVELGTDVRRLSLDERPRRFRLSTNGGEIAANRVIVASGPFGSPHIPRESAGFDPSLMQLHSQGYRRPADLPPGGVLVIGSGQTGVQLAEELQEAGREVVLSVGHCGRTLRRYRGRDTFWWMSGIVRRGPSLGMQLPGVTTLSSPRDRFQCNPHVSGHGGGHDTNLRQMARDGLRLVGRFAGAEGTTARFASDLGVNLRYADEFFDARLRPMLDRFIELTEPDAPLGVVPQVDYEPAEVERLDLAAEGITTVLWTSGYRPGLAWIDLPVLDDDGLPRTDAGVSDVPGLTFIGLPWLVDNTSSNLVGLERDAVALMARMWPD